MARSYTLHTPATAGSIDFAAALNEQQLAAVQSPPGASLVIAGAALFVRYSIARFMRFWLVRLVHEHRSETDRVIGALKEIETKLNK